MMYKELYEVYEIVRNNLYDVLDSERGGGLLGYYDQIAVESSFTEDTKKGIQIELGDISVDLDNSTLTGVYSYSVPIHIINFIEDNVKGSSQLRCSKDSMIIYKVLRESSNIVNGVKYILNPVNFTPYLKVEGSEGTYFSMSELRLVVKAL